MARSVDRLAHMRGELRRFGLTDVYRRLHAVDMPTERGRGCFASHMKAMETARGMRGIVHIVEDDVLLSEEMKSFLMSSEVVDLLERFDMLFLDMWVWKEEFGFYRRALANRAPVNMKGRRVGSMASYIVAPARIPKLLRLLKPASLSLAVDDAINRLVQSDAITAATMVPFLTGTDMRTGTHSSIQLAMDSAALRELIMLRTSFSAVKNRQEHFALDDPRL